MPVSWALADAVHDLRSLVRVGDGADLANRVLLARRLVARPQGQHQLPTQRHRGGRRSVQRSTTKGIDWAYYYGSLPVGRLAMRSPISSTSGPTMAPAIFAGSRAALTMTAVLQRR